jgi:hypothetical protein
MAPGGHHLTSIPAHLAAASQWLRAHPSARPAAVAAATSAAAAAAAAAASSSSLAARHASSSPPDPPSSASARYERAVSAGLRACARESHAYGRCATGYLPDAAPKGACEREFVALRRCFLAASGLGAWREEGRRREGC